MRRRRLADGLLAGLALSGCASIPPPRENGQLSGRVLVEWTDEDAFVYRRDGRRPLIFVTADGKRIDPPDMFTDGGSVPRIFWSIEGLSPWGLGPAYVIHDWLFFQHRCGPPGERDRFTFEEAALILAEVGEQLKKAGLVKKSADFLSAIRWAVQTGVARELWDRPATARNCATPEPVPATFARRAGGRIAADVVIPPAR